MTKRVNKNFSIIENFDLQYTFKNRFKRWWQLLFAKDKKWVGKITKSKYETVVLPFVDKLEEFVKVKYKIDFKLIRLTYDQLLDKKYQSHAMAYISFEKAGEYLLWVNREVAINNTGARLDDLIVHEMAHVVTNELYPNNRLPHSRTYQDIYEELLKEFRIPLSLLFKDDFEVVEINMYPISQYDIVGLSNVSDQMSVYIAQKYQKNLSFPIKTMGYGQTGTPELCTLFNHIYIDADLDKNKLYGFDIVQYDIPKLVWTPIIALKDENDYDALLETIKKKYVGKTLICLIDN